MEYAAHLRREDNGSFAVQSVQAHCRGCAAGAQRAAGPALQNMARLAGLLHDMGKYTGVFQTYLQAAARDEPVRRGSVNHTFAGARFVLERWHRAGPLPHQALTAELLAFAIGSHHGEFDCLAPDGTDGFAHRLTLDEALYNEARTCFLEQCATGAQLDGLFAGACEEVSGFFDASRSICKNQDEFLFQLSLLARNLLAAVIDGDRQDTAVFLGTRPPDTPPEPDWPALLSTMEARLRALPATTPVDPARRQISDLCRQAAGNGSGVFRLTVPTGGGKTLASLRYALGCTAAGKRRIFFVIPLLSVLEQNAAVWRDFLGKDCPVLEHHSNLVREGMTPEQLDENELLMEDWSAPVVITTLVQLLDTLFSHKTSCIRRMAALRNSVILIDEVQTVPGNMTGLFSQAVNYLAGFCGASVVLCSATQPALDALEHPVYHAPKPELAPRDDALWQVFRRTRIEDRRRAGGYTVDQLAQLAVTSAGQQGSALLVCNTKAQARGLFAAVSPLWKGALFHLSTAMCTAHRRQTLTEIHTALAQKQPVICVATQLVEAGVDFSFGCVIRLLAGMDNIVQAAGRCNRSGTSGPPGPVYIVNLQGENLAHLPDIRRAQTAAGDLLMQFERAPDRFGADLTGDAAIETYYRSLYSELPRGAQDYPIKKLGVSLYGLLSRNSGARKPGVPAYTLGQAFKTAGEAFQVFDDCTQDVLVPYGEGEALIARMCGEEAIQKARYDLAFRGALLQKAAPFTVSLFDYQLRQLAAAGNLVTLWDGAVQALQPEGYSARFGAVLGGADEFFEEVRHGSQKYCGI